MRVVFTVMLVFCTVTGAAAQHAGQAMGVPGSGQQEAAKPAFSEALRRPVVVAHAHSPRGMSTSSRLRIVSQPPYRPSSPPNRNTRGILIFAGVLGGMFAGGYVGYAVDSHWGNENAVKGVTTGGLAGGVLGGLAVWKLTR